MLERLQKIIARAGVTSRRHAEQLIRAGQVTVNGQVVTELGSKADAERDHIKVGGKLLRLREEKLYYILHKPAGCVSTMSDPEGRETIARYLRGIPGRVFPVGRLDYHAGGLLLVTNDGTLADRVLKAAGRLPQTYWLKVKGELSKNELAELARTTGVRLRLLSSGRRGAEGRPANPWYEATLSEARRDRLRRGLALLHHPAEKMKRVKLDGLAVASLPPGRYRPVTHEELRELEGSIGLAEQVQAGNRAMARRSKEFSQPRVRTLSNHARNRQG